MRNLLLVLAVALIASAAFLLSWGDEPPVADGAAHNGTLSEPAADAGIGAASTGAVVQPDEVERVSVADSPEIEVQVVDETGRAVAGAAVWYCTGDQNEVWQWISPRVHRGVEGVRYYADAPPVITDDAGTVLLAPGAGTLLLVAETAERAGQELVFDSQRASTHEVKIEPLDVHPVRVVDANGNPVAGVGVHVGQEALKRASLVHPCARTDADGIADLRFFGHRAGIAWSRGRPQGIVAECIGPARGYSYSSADEVPPISEIRLPPHGRVRVLMPAGMDARVVSLGKIDGNRGEVRMSQAEVHDGVAYFPAVGVGDYRLNLWARLVTESGVFEHQVSAPTQFGEEVLVDLCGSAEIILTGRVVDAPVDSLEQGYSKNPAFLNAFGASEYVTGTALRLQTDGSFRWRISPEHAGEEVSGFWYRYGEQVAEVILPMTLRSGVHDIGEFVPGPAPILVSGIVRLRDGMPVDDAYIEVGPNGQGQGFDDSRGFTSSDGSFTISRFSPLFAPHCVLRVDSVAGSLAEPVQFTAGEKDLLVEIEAGGTLEAAWSLAGLLFDVDLLIELTRSGASASEPAYGAAESTADDAGNCSSEWIGLPPGDYDLVVTIEDLPGEVLRLRNLRVPAGGSCADPRLRDLRLMDHLELVTVQIHLPDGTVPDAQQADVETLRDWWSGPSPAEFVGDGKWGLLLGARQSVDLVVVADGCLPVAIRGLRGDRAVRLQRGNELVLEVAGELPLRLDRRRELELRLAPLSQDLLAGELLLRFRQVGRADDGAPGRGFPVSVPGPGEYQLTWAFRDYSEDWQQFVIKTETTQVTIPANAIGGRLIVEPPAELWERLTERSSEN